MPYKDSSKHNIKQNVIGSNNVWQVAGNYIRGVPAWAIFIGSLCLVAALSVAAWQIVNYYERRRIQDQELVKEQSSIVFASELWPAEGVPKFKVGTEVLTIYDQPSLKSRVINELEVKPGTEIRFKDFRYITVSSGILAAREDGYLEGEDYGEIRYLSKNDYYQNYGKKTVSRTIKYRKGESIELVQYRAEGSSFIRKEGHIIVLERLPWVYSNSPLILSKNPITEGWIKVIDVNGDSVGWVIIDSNIVVETGRSKS